MKIYTDDLEIGQFVIITAEKEISEERVEQGWGFFGVERRQRYQINGYPIQIIAIELPFIMGRGYQGHTAPIDTRQVQLSKVGKEYVRAFIEDMPTDQPVAESFLAFSELI